MGSTAHKLVKGWYKKYKALAAHACGHKHQAPHQPLAAPSTQSCAACSHSRPQATTQLSRSNDCLQASKPGFFICTRCAWKSTHCSCCSTRALSLPASQPVVCSAHITQHTSPHPNPPRAGCICPHTVNFTRNSPLPARRSRMRAAPLYGISRSNARPSPLSTALHSTVTSQATLQAPIGTTR